MKIAFLENRYKTEFWLALARELKDRFGYETSWIVQNNCYAPRCGDKVVRLGYPPKSELAGCSEPRFCVGKEKLNYVARTDRAVRFFGVSTDHYPYYWDAIGRALSELDPDLIVGEATLFHEVMTSLVAEEFGIPYLSPSTPGYPPGRFCIYKHHRKSPVINRAQDYSETDVTSLIESVASYHSAPVYMRNVKNVLSSRPVSDPQKLRKLQGFFTGERFNTPSPTTKLRLHMRLKRALQEWKRNQTELSQIPSKKSLLFPMQLQPESNIDVWASEYNDQCAFIEELSSVAPRNWQVLVKANPKAKYELLGPLLDRVIKLPNVHLLPLDIGIGEVLSKVHQVITITGTLAVECVFRDIPVLQVGHGPLDFLERHQAMRSNRDSLESMVNHACNEGEFLASGEEKRQLSDFLFRTSFPGLVGDRYLSEDVMSPKNLTKVARALVEAHGYDIQVSEERV